MARVDALSSQEKEILQIGSAIEREFPLSLLAQVFGQEKSLIDPLLETLLATGLLYRYQDNQHSGPVLVFKHALTREVIYDSIGATRKKQLHNLIGSCIELGAMEPKEEVYTVLCHHFLHGENFAKAAEYAHLAGKQARRHSSYQIAIRYGRTCVECLEKLPRTEELELRIVDARTSTAN